MREPEIANPGDASLPQLEACLLPLHQGDLPVGRNVLIFAVKG
jgi:hypothetical protein